MFARLFLNRAICSVLLLLLYIPGISFATIIVGNLSLADDVVQYTFNLPTVSGVNIQTYQFGGNGILLPGGIDSVLTLFFGNNASATMVGYNDDGDCPPATTNPFCGDSTLQFSALASGNISWLFRRIRIFRLVLLWVALWMGRTTIWIFKLVA